MNKYRDPRIRDLPEEERELFNEWLVYNGQTRPFHPELPKTPEEQDFYYEHDYREWKSGNRKRKDLWTNLQIRLHKAKTSEGQK